ncbi:MAG: hypothetical protein OEX08_01170 [Candidatus Nomurabacteria bacterium]|nr:hypothetical protein [Candidatus Nomurabacteria bacterium]
MRKFFDLFSFFGITTALFVLVSLPTLILCTIIEYKLIKKLFSFIFPCEFGKVIDEVIIYINLNPDQAHLMALLWIVILGILYHNSRIALNIKRMAGLRKFGRM